MNKTAPSARLKDRLAPLRSDRIPWFHLTIQDATLETGRQDIAQHDESFFVRASREAVEASIGLGDSHILGLSAVDV
ncbi:MAG: hypothetical protein ABR880_20920 [Candidatus Sulfotelmatobacter sp.]